MKLSNAQLGSIYTISSIDTDDEELNSFLFTLGCYVGEQITIVSTISNNYVIVVKDARYTIDKDLADCIIVA